MEQEPLPSLDRGAALSLADLFAPRSGKPAQAAVQVSSLDIPPALASRWATEAQQGGYLPDTLVRRGLDACCNPAGWARRRWNSMRRWAPGPRPGSNCTATTDNSAWQWIAQVDRARRDARPTDGLRAPFRALAARRRGP